MGNTQNNRTLSDTVLTPDQEIRKYFGRETSETLRMEIDGISFALVRIEPDDEKNIRKFVPYCHGSPVGKYGLVWSTPCLQDFYVFDTRKYAVDFIVMSQAMWKG